MRALGVVAPVAEALKPRDADARDEAAGVHKQSRRRPPGFPITKKPTA
jgi:hypothetical protein